MDQRFLDYLAQYKENYVFTETERVQIEALGIKLTVTLYEFESETECRNRADILLEKDGLRYGCEGIERSHWDFFPVTVDNRSYILFSKTLYGFTLLDPETLAEVYDYFPEKVYGGEESFIITDAQTFGHYLIFEGCYWGSPYGFAAYDHGLGRFANLSDHCEVYDGGSRIEGDRLIIVGLDLDMERTEVSLTEQEIDSLMLEDGVDEL